MISLLTLTERHSVKQHYQGQEDGSYEDSKGNIRFDRYQRTRASLIASFNEPDISVISIEQKNIGRFTH